MKKLIDQDPETKSTDLLAENVIGLKALFPEVFVDGKVDFDVLKQLFGGKVDETEEKYGLNWHGKRRARQIALTPSTGTLRPAPDESVNWDTTQNLIIEGDNLEVLKLLQKSYTGKIKLIYIDPPYNTGGDFVYQDDFKDNIANYLMLTNQVDADGRKITSNTESSGRYHTDWLNMMYPRLKLARNLLTDDGLILIHIDEHEQASLAMLLQEIFGEENNLGTMVWDKRNPKGDARGIAYQHESIAAFARDANILFERSPLKRSKRNAQRMLDYAKEAMRTSSTIESATKKYREWLKTQGGLSGGEVMYDRIFSDGRVYRLVSMAWPNKKKAPDQYFIPLIHPMTKRACPVPERGWRNPPETMKELISKELIEFGPDENTQPQRRYFLEENMFENVPSIIPYGGSDDDLLKELGIPFDQPKPVILTSSLISWFSGKDDIVLDFFAGSGTVGHAVVAQNAGDNANRHYILVQLPEPTDPANTEQKVVSDFCDHLRKPRNIAEITKERLRRSNAKVSKDYPSFKGDFGFRVFKLDSSNIRAWEPDRDDLAATLERHTEHLKTDRTENDILFELLLKLGLDLTVPMDEKPIAGKTVHSIGAGTLIVCLAEKIETAEVEPLAQGIIKWHRALAPAGETQLVFRDSAFANDVTKTNLAAILEQNGLPLIRSL